MTLAAFVTALALPVLGAPTFTVGANARAELRAREPGDAAEGREVGTPPHQAWDTDLSGGLDFAARQKHWTFDLRYQPRLTLQNFAIRPVTNLLHAGTAAFGYHVKRIDVTLAEQASYGTRSDYSFAPVADTTAAGTPPTPTQPVPPSEARAQALPRQAQIRFDSTNTSLSSTVALTKRASVGVGGGYTAGGGRDEASRAAVPTAFGPYGWANFTLSLRHDNALLTALNASSTETRLVGTPSTHAVLLSAAEAWRKQWGRHTSSRLAVELDVARTTPLNRRFRAGPAGSAAVTHGIVTGPHHALLELTADAGAGFVVDRLTGETSQRAQVDGNAKWTYRQFTAYVQGSHTAPLGHRTANALTLTTVAFGVRQQLLRFIGLEAGARTFKQSIATPTTATTAGAYSGAAWMEFVAVTITAAPYKL